MASDDPRIGAEVTDLSVDAKNTVIASDLTGGGEQRHGWSTVARQRRSTLKSNKRSPAAAQLTAAVIVRIQPA